MLSKKKKLWSLCGWRTGQKRCHALLQVVGDARARFKRSLRRWVSRRKCSRFFCAQSHIFGSVDQAHHRSWRQGLLGRARPGLGCHCAPGVRKRRFFFDASFQKLHALGARRDRRARLALRCTGTSSSSSYCRAVGPALAVKTKKKNNSSRPSPEAIRTT